MNEKRSRVFLDQLDGLVVGRVPVGAGDSNLGPFGLKHIESSKHQEVEHRIKVQIRLGKVKLFQEKPSILSTSSTTVHRS